ncbi:unnamed protein product [Polarella glacialis]|uniref:Serine protease n=1 Tax=Polarella glacialis TaxID=89957 RepID=A0A813LD63_POLGL|nr:unnamed protein product [Polarella glacialis]
MAAAGCDASGDASGRGSSRPWPRRRASASALLALALSCRKAFTWLGPSSLVASAPPHLRLAGSSQVAGSSAPLQSAAPPRRGRRLSAAAVGATWELRREQMILPAARIVTPTGTQGSGFVVAHSEGATYVLTNHHVIRDCIQQNDRWDPVDKSSKKVEQLLPVSVETFRYDERGRHLQTVTTSAEIAAYTVYGDKWSFEGDLALLKLKIPLEGVPAVHVMAETTFVEEVRMLDEVIMVGCPDGSETPLPSTGHVASVTEQRAGVGLMLSQVFGNPGSSGSAVYRFSDERQQFEVVAVHSMIDGRGSLTDAG